ncbi:MAG: right-handed parallel beta-helix repeat-containing protein, partial [Firmicutes bacterium]|nr:right-handed parallel beta-helix repeat-containing protein [Bacillota bacterium]
CSYNTRLNLIDTTIKGNKTVDSGSYTGGLHFGTGWINWQDSAVYGNALSGSGESYANDIYVSDSTEIHEGEIPLAKDMSDHGKKLTGYVLVASRYNEIATKPINKSERARQEWTVELANSEEEIAETGGKNYRSIEAAVNAAEENGTVTLLKDVTLGESFTGKKGLILDLDGHTLTGKSTGSGVLTVNDGEVTIKNGTIANCSSTSNQRPALYANKATVNLENVKFENNLGSAVRIHSAPGQVSVKDCTFTGNGKKNMEYCVGLELIATSGTVENCKFDDNSKALRIAETSGTVDVKVKGCEFKNSLAKAIDILIPKGSTAVFENCTITGTKDLEEYEKDTITIEAVGSGKDTNGGSTTFDNCVIKDNKSREYTINVEAGELTMKNSLIQGNVAEISGGIFVDIWSSLVMKDTVVKENTATGKSIVASGGITLRSATLIVNDYDYELGRYVSTNLGLLTSSIKMEGGAIYNNKTLQSSPAADDLYVSRNCNADIPKVEDFVDGNEDFSGKHWLEDMKNTAEEKPKTKTTQARYYIAGAEPGLRQIYVDGVNGSDENTGSEENPVKSLERATELAKQHNSRTVYIMNTVSIQKKTSLKDSIMKSFVAYAADESDAGVLDMDGKTIKREPGFTGYLINIKPGESLKITNTIIDGNGVSSNKALSS